ncbi:MAG: asparagine synthase (glutamine-hydrolyzing) [Planctomycetes bacterium]|nr:asparagine synthase (glutamine-hydrolyzing) [Planctomycetota bacterium]
MCGLVAFLRLVPGEPGADREAVAAVRDRMRARGPDGEGLWQDTSGRVTLGHRRLAIRDLAATGAQPMVDPFAGSVLVFNGELYDVGTLRESLPDRGASLRGTSDTEVLLHALREQGPDVFRDLRGMYAVAFWDAPRRRLVVARDPYGIKPLYVARTPDGVWLASQVRALLAVPGVRTAPEPAGHVGYFLFGHVPDPWTLHEGIEAVPAGAVVEIDTEGGTRTLFVRDVLAPLRDAPADGVHVADEEVASFVRQSVQAHVVADVPVGVFLSAGIDSSVVATAAAQASADARTLTMGFGLYRGTSNDEVPGAEASAEALGTRHTTAWLEREDVAGVLDQLLADMDQPTLDGVNTWFVSRAAAASGLKVALSGLGGDELFGGYPSFGSVPRAARSLRLVRRVPGLGRGLRRLLSLFTGGRFSPKWAAVPELAGTWWGAYLLRRGLFLRHELKELLAPELVRAGWERLDLPRRLEATVTGMASDHARVLALESTWYMRHQLLRDADWAGMAHGVEIRVPLVDATLLGQLAPRLVASPPPTKDLLRPITSGVLPDDLFTRRKTGFSVPLREWFAPGSDAGPSTGGRRDRGLRGWARAVHAAFGQRHDVHGRERLPG